MAAGQKAGTRVHSSCLEKRSQALQGCNLARDIQVEGAPMVHLASCGPCRGRPRFLIAIGHLSYALKTPGGTGGLAPRMPARKASKPGVGAGVKL